MKKKASASLAKSAGFRNYFEEIGLGAKETLAEVSPHLDNGRRVSRRIGE